LETLSGATRVASADVAGLGLSLVVEHRRNLSRRVRAFMKWIENVLAPYLE
jgi:hypothetical protein